MHILISQLNSAVWLREELSQQPDVQVSALHAERVDLGDFGGSAPLRSPGETCTVHTLPVFPLRPYPYSMYRGDLGRLLREIAPDIIYHLGEPSELNTAQVVRAARRHCPNAPIVLFSFENVVRCWRGFPRCLRGVAQRHVLPRLDMVAACTRSAQSTLEREGLNTGRIEVVYQAVNPGFFPPTPDPELRRTLCDDQSFLIGYVGRLVAEKGVDILLRALAELPREFSLCVLGDGRAGAGLQALAGTLGVADRVRWLGRVERAQMPRYLSNLDALVLPSRSIPTWQEQFGAVLVEAMYCDTVVVGSSSGAIPEVIGDAGLIFPEEDHGALAGCLQELRRNPQERVRLARAGRERALREFTVDVYIRRLMALFQRVLDQKARAGSTQI